MMEAAENRVSLDDGARQKGQRQCRGGERGWTALPDSLMRARVVEVRAILAEDVSEMTLSEEKDVGLER